MPQFLPAARMLLGSMYGVHTVEYIGRRPGGSVDVLLLSTSHRRVLQPSTADALYFAFRWEAEPGEWFELAGFGPKPTLAEAVDWMRRETRRTRLGAVGMLPLLETALSGGGR